MKVRFAEVCDRCGKRSAEYSSFWICQECLDTICRECAVADSPEDDTGLCTCKKCAGELAA